MKLLRSELPEAFVIAMDILPEQADVVEFVEAGGSGFILKSASPEGYVDTITAVARGEKVLPAVLTASLFTQIVESALQSGKGIPDSAIKLTSREKQIVDLISEGLSNKEVDVRDAMDDVVDAVIDKVLSSAGNVVFTPPGSLRDQERIALLLRDPSEAPRATG